MKPIVFLLVFALLDLVAVANPLHTVPPMAITPTNLKSGNQYYDMDLSGIGKYMDSLKSTDPETYQQVLPDYEAMKLRQNIAYGALGLGVGTSLVLFAGSASFLRNERLEYDGTVKQDINLEAIGIGTLAAISGISAFWIIKPGRSSTLNFINKHNRSTQSSPLEINLGWSASKKLPNIALQKSF